MPGQHGPAGLHRLLPPVIGTVLDLETRDGDGWRRDLRAYITGDTLNVPRLREVTERFPDVDVMVAPGRLVSWLTCFHIRTPGSRAA